MQQCCHSCLWERLCLEVITRAALLTQLVSAITRGERHGVVLNLNMPGIRQVMCVEDLCTDSLRYFAFAQGQWPLLT